MSEAAADSCRHGGISSSALAIDCKVSLRARLCLASTDDRLVNNVSLD